MNSTKQDIQGADDLNRLVEAFYQKVLADAQIGYIFTQVMQLDFAVHLPKIAAFWTSVLFGTGDYSGNPMTKHIELHRKEALTAAHFARWLSLWIDTTDALFAGAKAEECKAKARNIADMMQFKIGQLLK
jgi:hemoglobin